MNFKSTLRADTMGKATVIIAVFSVLAKISGLARDAIFSHNFGTGVIVDAYFAAFRIPDFVFNLLILGTFSVAFIPVFSEYLLKDKKKAFDLASSILNVTLLGIVALSILALIFVDPLISLIAPGFKGEAYDLTRKFTQILLLSPILLSLSSVTSSILNTYKKFTLVSLAPVIYNLSIIFGVVVLYPIMGPIGLPLGVVIGSFLHFAVQLPQIFALGYRFRPIINSKEPGFIKFWKLYWPRIFSMGVGQITALVASIFGSFLGSGALSTFYYANNLQSVFLGVFAVSAALAVFPTLSDLYNEKNEQGFKDVLAKTTIQILYFIIPLSVLMLIMRAQIVRLVLGIGQNTSFTFADTRIVSLTLGLFVVSLFAQALAPLFTRAFYARHDTMIPVVIGFATIGVNVFITYYMARKYGIPGMALAFSLTSIFQLILLTAELYHKIGHFHDEYIIVSSLKIVIASLVSGLLSYVSLYIVAPWVNMHTYFGILIQATAAAIVGGVVYLLVTLALGMSETKNIVSLLKNVLNKLNRPFAAIWNMME
ncbi:MAG TPA: murein biosynthesis integral membrane protein MurJ [Patescibacteria group bacterium]|jgi:putative peptidoglycan lipid II flippase|nr:murein biosynthesis integral membrane protein MurJ [Patescibacteria group bacterium]